MVCINGRVRTDDATKRRLFAKSGGYCQRPECHASLFPEDIKADVTVAEIAHIIASSSDGPRSDSSLANRNRANFENLILLCPTCHTIIDKAAEEFPSEMIMGWKQHHEERLRNTFGIAECGDRTDARRQIEPLLSTNGEIFKSYGPDNEYRYDPEAPEASVWSRKMRGQIIPNNKRILLSVDVNRALLHDDEKEVVEEFRQHVDDLISKHVLDERPAAKRFPSGITSVFV